MKRRVFIGLLGGSVVGWSLSALGQEPGRVYRLAMVTPVGRDEPASLAFLEELRQQGFVEGQNLAILGGRPISNEQIDKVVPAILDADPNVILTGGDVVARAFQKATRSIPLVVMTEDMVAGGYVASLARPDANVTGVSLMSPDLDGKRPDILIEAVPGARRIAVLAIQMSQTCGTSRGWRSKRTVAE